MPVTLRVSSHQSGTLGANAVRVFDRGGTIGRSPDNDWVLPDAERWVSGQHAVISFEDGAYQLTDRSTNGTIVNGRELPQGGRVRLSDGDRLTIGNYEISVAVDSRSDVAPAHLAASAGDGDIPFGAPASVDPLDFFSDPGPSSASQRIASGAVPDHIPPEAEYFPPPRVQPETPPRAAPEPPAASGGAFIPEDWDSTGFSMPGESAAPPAPAAEADFFASPVPTPGRPAAAPVRTETPAGDATGRHREAASRQHATGRYPEATDPHGNTTGRHGDATGRHPEPTGRHADGLHAAQQIHPNAHHAGDVDALLHAAGIDPAAVDAETLASLGDILRVVVGGLMEVLHARAELKNQFRVAMTTLKPVENNPLKFSANAEDALFNLFARRGQSFKAPVDAFREAFDDLKAHQIAMMAGMRAAFGSLLKRFDPDELQTAFDRGLKRAAILDVINKTKYWELYREMYAELGDDDTTFRRLFGDEFAQAYEEQMQRLTALQKR